MAALSHNYTISQPSSNILIMSSGNLKMDTWPHGHKLTDQKNVFCKKFNIWSQCEIAKGLEFKLKNVKEWQHY